MFLVNDEISQHLSNEETCHAIKIRIYTLNKTLTRAEASIYSVITICQRSCNTLRVYYRCNYSEFVKLRKLVAPPGEPRKLALSFNVVRVWKGTGFE